jgi:hypothetical protein
MNTKLRTSLLALGAAALLIPAGAVAKSDKAAGKGKSDQAKGQSKAKNAVFSGSVVSVDAATGTVVVHVTKTNKWGRRFDEQDVAFTVAGVKKLGVRDVTNDGKTDLADVFPEDKAHVQAKIAKDAAAPLAARKFKVQYPEAETE